MRANLLITVFAIMAALAFLSWSDQADSLDITKVIQGTVRETKGNSIKIIDGLDGKEVRISIDSNTAFDNVQKLTDLGSGDKVQIDYKTNHDKKIAITITKIEEETGDSV